METVRRFGLPLLAGAVVVLGLVLLWAVRSPGAPPEVADAAETGESPPEGSTASAAPAVEHAKPVIPMPRRIHHTARAEDMENHDMEVKLEGALQQRVLAEAARCYGDEPGKDERLHVSYTLRFHNGVATLADVTQVSSEFAAPRLEDCVVDKLRSFSWRDPDMPNMNVKLSTSMSIHDLRRRHRDMSDSFGK